MWDWSIEHDSVTGEYFGPVPGVETQTLSLAAQLESGIRVLDIRCVGALKKDEDVIGNRTRVKVVKNKMAPPFREVEFDILYGQGISKEGDLVDLAAEANVVEKSGAWFSFGGERIGQGRENAKQFLLDHPEVSAAIEGRLLAHHNVRRIGVEVAPETGAASAATTASDAKGGRVNPAPAAAPSGNGKRPNA